MKTPIKSNKKIFVAGTWDENKSMKFKDQAFLLGKQIAERGHDLICGPGTGISKYVISGFHSVADRIGNVTFYLPARHEMEKAGEMIGEGADVLIETEFDYPMRNIYQIGFSDGLVVLTGGDGTLEELIAALADYKLPVAVYRDSGIAAKALELLLPLFPEWKENVFFGENIPELIDYIFSKSKIESQ